MTTYYVTTSGSDSNNGLTEGAAFATPGYAASVATTAGDIVYIKAGTYTLSNTTQNTSGGPISISQSVVFEGYDATIGDQAAKPIINAGSQSVSSVIYFNNPGYNRLASQCKSIEVDGNSVATTGIDANTSYTGTCFNCIVRNCTSRGYYGYYQKGFFVNCSGYNNAINFDGGTMNLCFTDGGGYGYKGSISAVTRSIAINATDNGFDLGHFTSYAASCTAYNNTNAGFKTAYDIAILQACLSVNNNHGFNCGNNANADALLVDCADYNNTSGRSYSTTNTTRDYRPINLTADPFVSASTGDFRINDVAGGGAELRQIQLSGLAGVNSSFDVGAVDAVIATQLVSPKLHPLG